MAWRQVLKKQDNQKTGKFKIRSFAGLIRQTKPQYWQLLVGLTLGLIATLGQLVVPKFAQLLVNEFSKGLNGTLLAIIIALFILSAVISAISGTFFWEPLVSK